MKYNISKFRVNILKISIYLLIQKMQEERRIEFLCRYITLHYLEEVVAKLNSLLGVPVPINEADDDGCPRSNVAISHGAPIRMVEVSV